MATLSSAGPGELPPYTVRCIDVDPIAEADGHHHVIAIETSDPDGGETRWTLVQVIAAVRDGERFIVGGSEGGQAADLGPTVCPRCRMATLSWEASGSGVTLNPCP